MVLAWFGCSYQILRYRARARRKRAFWRGVFGPPKTTTGLCPGASPALRSTTIRCNKTLYPLVYWECFGISSRSSKFYQQYKGSPHHDVVDWHNPTKDTSPGSRWREACHCRRRCRLPPCEGNRYENSAGEWQQKPVIFHYTCQLIENHDFMACYNPP